MLLQIQTICACPLARVHALSARNAQFTDHVTPAHLPPSPCNRSLKAIYYLQKAGLNQVAYVKGGLPIWAREGYPMAQGPEDLSAVPALQPEAQEEAEQGSSSSISSLLGGLKLPEIKLPQFSFGSARR
jgi:hypothetical protein